MRALGYYQQESCGRGVDGGDGCGAPSDQREGQGGVDGSIRVHHYKVKFIGVGWSWCAGYCQQERCGKGVDVAGALVVGDRCSALPT